MEPQQWTDAAFVAAVESATYPGAAFRHREHVRLAWLCLRAEGFVAGLERLRVLIRGFATANGAPGKFHETQTRAWAELVQAALDRAPRVDSFDDFLALHTELADSRRLVRHYRPETLGSERARDTWCPPDLEPLPRRIG
ncbi:hypothetical protein DRW03_35715 [Corallococcus sp. H22C18031201]|uniref:hypothetical protein n=1 Tax=Citreicoccus inhibens TaxID=2849499 RepID=UPI000E735474|nr:hypothetical protein [Citreicoccus inhibens]MBU8900752.1 hypothetical protein [Citreicoccus inhibens]RJS13871.1 hypothetical protein DRW03_35715 [Corallococcus sp. H22C18031201]